MSKNWTLVLAVLAGLAFGLAPWPAYSQVTVVMSGLDNPRGLAFGPDGGLYVAEAGRGGTLQTSFILDGQQRFFGTTGAISRLLSGVQERVVTGLPSHANMNGTTASGLQDIAFNSSGEAIGVMGLGTGPTERATLGNAGAHMGQLVRLSLTGGPVQPIADLATYEATQNPDGVEIHSNPFGLLITSGGFIVPDAGANSVFGVTDAGVISTRSVLPPLPNPLPGPPTYQSVPTRVALGLDGAYYLGQLTGFPFPVGTANVFRLDPVTGNRTIAHTGFTNIVDLNFDADGNLYVLQISTNGLAAPTGPSPGALIKVEAGSGTRTTIASQGLSFPTGFTIGPDRSFYISNMGTSPGGGQVLRVIPEPSTLKLIGFAFVGLLGCAWRRRKTV